MNVLFVQIRTVINERQVPAVFRLIPVVWGCDSSANSDPDEASVGISSIDIVFVLRIKIKCPTNINKKI